MRRKNGFHVSLAVTVLATSFGFAGQAYAISYASGVRNTGGNTWEFVLNDAADSVNILRDGGNALNMGGLAPGRHTFDMTGFSTFSIQVSRNIATQWTELSQSNSSNAFTNYFRPNSVAVNKDPASPYFGTVYVNNSVPSATGAGRTMGDGIYALTADLVGVDLPTRAVIADANDASLAKRGSNWINGGTNSGYQMSLDAAGNLIVGDWSDAAGGIKYINPDLTSGGLILDIQDGITPLLTNSDGKEIHGSIASKPYTTGSVGNGLTVYAMDEDFDQDGETLINATNGNNVWKWNVANATSYDQPPQLVIASTPLATAVNDPNPPANDPGRTNYLNLNVGVDAKAIYSPQHNKWYLTENRNDGNQAGLVVVTADGVDGTTPTMDWSSIQWSIDHSLDGFTDDADPTGTTADNGLQDVFRGMGTPTLSDDGTKLYVHRRLVPAADTFVGTTSPLSGAVIVIPLDANGLPDIQINDNGTPGDTSDDVFTNLQSITIASNNSNTAAHDITLDAAGNVYVGSNISERVQVFSPAGNYMAVTDSSGGFSVTAMAGGVAGDFNGNGVVDAADYTVWRDHLGAADESSLMGNGDGMNGVDAGDYNLWKTNFGMTAGSGAASAGAVPEPCAAVLMVFGLMTGCLSRFRRRKEAI